YRFLKKFFSEFPREHKDKQKKTYPRVQEYLRISLVISCKAVSQSSSMSTVQRIAPTTPLTEINLIINGEKSQ
ncbi:MAG: hypothetical protein II230_06040, partial [Clostridia bacterium]|nr:hypothetical protein [Clostridia bacterium]